MSEQTPFGTLLRRYRTASGLTQEALAARAQLSARTIADLERGINRLPRHDTFELLISALDLTSQQRALLLATVRPEMTAQASGPHALPRFPLLPPLVGREQEMTCATTFLQRDEVRLLTLTGPAGVGKTRLGLEIARDLSESFADGIVFVSLATLRDASQLAGAIGQALGLRESLEIEVSEQVVTFLQEKHVLLVLDNFEQIVEAALFVVELLSSCPHLSILVTSRVPLHLRAEQALPLAPLPLADAVALFQARARMIQPGGAYAAREVAAICEQLDRLPLAIELAAMHVQTFSLPDLHKRLTQRLALLRDGARDLPVRQQTMEDAIAWSYELLNEAQQRYFRALGIFVGGWTLEAAEAVCRSGEEKTAAEIILSLAALVDASLVQVDIPAEGPARFSMLELIREFALRRLRAAGEEDSYKRRHALYYAQLAENASSQEREHRAREAFLLQDVANVRAAIAWTEERQEIALGLHLARFSWGSWVSQGQMSEAESILGRMLNLSWQSGGEEVPLGPRAEALYALGQHWLRCGKVERAQALAQEALSHSQKSVDHCGISSALAILGQIAQRSGNLEKAASLFAESDEHATLGGFPNLRGFTLRNLAELARMRGDLARATTLYEEALAVVEAMGMTFGVATIIVLLGHLARQQQYNALAKARYREGLMLLRTFDSPTYTAWCLEGLATIACAEGRYDKATCLSAAAAARREQAQTPLPPAEREALEQVIATARTAQEKSAFVREWERGSALTQDEVIEDALSD